MLLSGKCILALVFLVVGILSERTPANLLNVHVDRAFDLDSHTAFVKVTCKIKNTGNTPVTEYLFYMDPKEEANKVSYILGGPSKYDLKLLTRASDVRDEAYILNLEKSLEPGDQTTVFVEYMLFDCVHPFPTSIKQTDSSYVRINFSPVLYSCYKTSSQSITMSLPSKSVLSYSKKPEPVEMRGTALYYGPYTEQPAFTRYPGMIHYQNNRPFLKVKHLDRLVKVSHWTSVTVEDKVHLVHIGPNLSQGFSRLDYMQTNLKPTAVASFVSTLPAAARNIYYRDCIGNISTSSIEASSGALLLELTPRYPLFGGWQTTYMTGYDLPASRYLKNKGKKFVLRVRMLDHLMTDMEVEEMVLRIALPEHSRDITIKAPYPLAYKCDAVTMAYLDTVGRPTCTIKLQHLSNWHSQFVEVSYTFDNLLILRKPLYVSAVLFCLFLAAIVAVRLDFSIVEDKNFEQKMRLLSRLKAVRDRLKDYQWTFYKISKALKKFKTDRNFQQLDECRKRIDVELRAYETEIKSFEEEFAKSNKAYAERISAISRLINTLRESFRTCVQSAERLASGKGSKQTYGNAEQNCLTMIEQLNQKIASGCV